MRPLAQFALSFSLAVGTACLLAPEALWLPLGLAFAVVWAGCTLLLRGKGPRLSPALCAAGLAVGFVWTLCWTALFLQPLEKLDGVTVRLTGTVADWPQETDYGFSVILLGALEGAGSTRVLVYTDEQGARLRPGDRVETVARLTLSHRAASGQEITYYTAQGILLRGKAYGDLTVVRPEGVDLRRLPLLLCRGLKEGLSAVLTPRAAALTAAVTTGDTGGLDDAFSTQLRRAGLSHAVAVSGTHLVFLSAALSLLLGRHRRRTAVAVCLASVFFALMTGASPAVIRAAVTVILLHTAPFFHREADGPTSLSLALLLLLGQNPLAAAHVGLQFSFAAVAGILLCTRRLDRALSSRLPRIGRDAPLTARLGGLLLRMARKSLALTLGAMLFTVPLSALHFGQTSLIAPVSNLLCLWAFSGLFFFGLSAGAVGAAFPAVGTVLALPAQAMAEYLFAAVPPLGNLPFSSVPAGEGFFRVWLIFFYLCLALALWIPGRKKVASLALVWGLSLAAAAFFHQQSYCSGPLTASVLDVGQGQSVLLRRENYFALVDCGGDGPRNAGDVAADFLAGLGRGRLDALILTHCHADHAGGVEQLLRRVEVGLLLLPDLEEDNVYRHRILALAQELGIPLRLVGEGETVSLGPEGALTVFPPLGQRDLNERGLSVLASVGQFDVLVTGDMGSEVEELLLTAFPLPVVEVLVAGHHGSRGSTSSALLEAVTPEIAVISAGLSNSFGHPHPETLGRLTQAGTDIYRTDWMGTVTVHAPAG